MSQIRWKLSGGILILSMGGLVAVADMPDEVPAEPAPVILELPALNATPEEKPAIDAPPATPILSITSSSIDELELPPLELSSPTPTAEQVLELAPMPRKVMQVESIEVEVDLTPLPQVPVTEPEAPIETPAIAPADVAPLTPPLPKPIAMEPLAPIAAPMVPEPVVEQPAPALPPIPFDEVKGDVALEPKPAVSQAPPMVREQQPRELQIEPAPSPAPASETLGYTLTSRTLKVLVHMGGERPWFELRDRDEMYLKVICDNIDVHSPKETDKPVSTIRATGNIRYITPGGQGSCDDLTVSPKDGEVQVKGNVRFRYNWGQVRTTLSAETMTFRLDPIEMNDDSSKELPASYTSPN